MLWANIAETNSFSLTTEASVHTLLCLRCVLSQS